MTRLRTLSTDVAWQPWSRSAFDRARAEGKPVLLSISAEWCGWCRDMDRTTYADPSIATAINERFVPVRVDVDRRPDISERYSLGGWPTTAFLTPDGGIAGGGTFVAVDRMPGVLAQVESAFAAHHERIGAPIEQSDIGAQYTGSPRHAVSGDLADRLFDTFDEQHGGFGAGPKFPLTGPLRLALALWTLDHDARHEAILLTSLDAMGWGGLYDQSNGGFFRYAAARDWQQPHTAKLLEPNAALLRLYLEAGAALGLARFTERGADVLRYLQTWLADPVDGGWFGSQQADDAYYESSAEERERLAAPPVSRRLYADGNAAMASAALHAAGVFGDEGLRDFALKSLERVLLSCYRPGHGVAHDNDGHPGVRGLLNDQVLMAAACLDAHEVTENIVYEMMAEELMHFAVRTMWNDERGGFFDRAACSDDEAVGLMRTRLSPFVTNCDAAQLLYRLAATSGDHDFRTRADETLAAMAPLAADHGPLAAHYVLAMRAAALR
jgi:uncharacterized protein YyaL (SSP411 family)